MGFRSIVFALPVMVLALLTSCSEDVPVTDVDDMKNIPFTRDVSFDTSMVTIVQSVNFCDWQAMNKAVSPVRTRFSIETREVYQGLLDTNLVISLSDVDDLEKARTYASSDLHTEPFASVSTNNEVKNLFLDQQLEYTKETTDTIVFYMSFKTMKYERWEKAFLDDYRENPKHEFEVTRIFRGINDPDHVHMIFLANDPQYVEKMEKNTAFRMKMLAAGVVSYPVTYKLSPSKA